MESQEAFWTGTDLAASEILRTSPATVFIVRGKLAPRECGLTDSVRMIPDLRGDFSPVPQTMFPAPPPIPFEHLGSKQVRCGFASQERRHFRQPHCCSRWSIRPER